VVNANKRRTFVRRVQIRPRQIVRNALNVSIAPKPRTVGDGARRRLVYATTVTRENKNTFFTRTITGLLHTGSKD